MKKLLLVGVVGLSALLAGCGGSGSDCEEEVLPPVTEAQFPNGQSPDYIVRGKDDIGFSRVVRDGLTAQVLSIETDPKDKRVVKVVVQEFIADYSEGYMTKPTNNVHEYGHSQFVAVLGDQRTILGSDDLDKVSKSLMTVKMNGYSEDVFGNKQPTFDIHFPVTGILNEVTDTSFIVNGMEYPRGVADDNEGSMDIVIGGHVSGMMDGEKLNITKLSFAAPAWGYSHSVEVDTVIDETSFSYLNHEGNSVTVHLNTIPTFGSSDRMESTEKLVAGSWVVVSGSRIDDNTMETHNARVYFVE